MNVLWLFPPMGEGFPNVSQYRFYKRMPIRASIIYPYLAASGVTQIKKAGHDVQLIDCATEDKPWIYIWKNIAAAQLIILEGRTPIIKELWSCIKKIRSINPYVRIAVYGDHVSHFPDETLSHGADFIISGGDYDYGAAMLLKNLSQESPPKILEYKVLDLDLLPFVDRELVNWRLYYESWKKRDVFLWNMSQRGCSFSCVYCAWAGTFWNNQIRYRTPGKVAEESYGLWKKYGDLEILDDADLFDFSWGLAFAKQLLTKGLRNKEVLWSCQTHPSQIYNLEALRTMKKSGLSVVKLGIESSIDGSLKIMKKGSTRKINERAIRLLQEAKIMVHANMMLGFPWETKEDVLETMAWIKKLDPNQAQFSLLIPYPNTELWNMAQDNDWFIQDKMSWELYDASFPMLKMDGLSGSEIVDLYRKCWSSFYLNRKFVWRHIKTIRHWEGLKNLWRGFRSVYFGHMRAVDRERKE